MAEGKISRVAAVEATKVGGDLARAGKSVTEIPYKRTDEPSYEDFMAHHALKGYAAAARQ